MAHPSDTHRTYCCPPSKKGKTASCLLGWGEAVWEMPRAEDPMERQQLKDLGGGLSVSNLNWRSAYICGNSPAPPHRRVQ